MALDFLLVDEAAFALFAFLSVGYHVLFAVVLRPKPAWSVTVRMFEHRRAWVDAVLRRGERIMAVQTLRNLIMTNTFLASTMILLVAFIANYVVLAKTPLVEEHKSWLTGATPVPVKGVVLLVLYAFAFVMFLSALRTLNQLSILVGVEPEELRGTEQRDPTRFLAAKFNGAEAMASYGRRAVFFSVPVFGWFFSPWLFAALTVGIWAYFVFALDFVRQRTPTPQTSGAGPGGAPFPK